MPYSNSRPNLEGRQVNTLTISASKLRILISQQFLVSGTLSLTRVLAIASKSAGSDFSIAVGSRGNFPLLASNLKSLTITDLSP